MNLYVSAKSQVPDLVIEYFEIILANGRCVNVQWAESSVKRENDDYTICFKRLRFDTDILICMRIADVLLDEDSPSKVLELRMRALAILRAQLDYYRKLGYVERLIEGIAEKRAAMIMKATTKTEMDRVMKPRAPRYDGGKFVPDEYHSLTVSFGEFIGMKNCAYIDTNNCSFAEQLLKQGIATPTQFTKMSGFWEYPLWLFDEETLKAMGAEAYELYHTEYEKYMADKMPPADE